MEFKVKDVDITTGSTLVAILNFKDAAMLDFHVGDRLKIQHGKKSTVAVLDIAESAKAVKKGHIGLMEEVLKKIGAKENSIVKIFMEPKPESLALIRKKLEGRRLSSEDINIIVSDIVKNKLTSVEITYFVSATYTNGMNTKEIVSLTKAMIKTGKTLKINRHPIMDKHCIGGVAGNRTTMIVVPILIAAGYCVPKTSSRSITSPAGTADTMEVLCKVDLDIKQIKKVVKKVGGCMVWGGAVNLAPADDKIITVEHPLRIDATGQLLASILAKKGSVSATNVLIDIPTGNGAKIKLVSEAEKLKKQFQKIGKKLGMKIKVAITDGSEPIGNGIGPVLEARDVVRVLKNHPKAPQDLRKKSLLLASQLIKSCSINGRQAKNSYALAKEMITSGKAWTVMKKIIVAQGANTDPEKLLPGEYTYDFKAKKTGKISHIYNATISKIARVAGAPFDKEAGIYLYYHKGDKVTKKETIFTIYSKNKQKLSYAKEILKTQECIRIN